MILVPDERPFPVFLVFTPFGKTELASSLSLSAPPITFSSQDGFLP